MRWFERQRQEWIAKRLRRFGFINRKHIEDEFGISTPQASHDLKVFQELNPKAIAYDVYEKRYVADPNYLKNKQREPEVLP